MRRITNPYLSEFAIRTFRGLASVTLLDARASQSAAPERIAVASAAKRGPQYYSGDHARFSNVEEKATIAGVAVTCKATSDGKAGQCKAASTDRTNLVDRTPAVFRHGISATLRSGDPA